MGISVFEVNQAIGKAISVHVMDTNDTKRKVRTNTNMVRHRNNRSNDS